MTTEKYYKIQPFIRASFQFRRKTLRNNLKGFVRNVTVLEDPYFTIRPEDVAPEMYLELYERLMIQWQIWNVKNNMECGIAVKNYNDLRVGDIIEAYEIIEVKQKLK